MATTTLPLPAGATPATFDEGSIVFIGTATVLLRYAGFTILTDPNFLHRHDSMRLAYGLLRSRRLTEPALTIDQLPPIDLVVLSHLHEDHFDRIAIRDLDKALPIVTTDQAARGLTREGFVNTHALATWETFTATKGEARLRITAMPGIHAPGPLAKALPPVMGSMLEFGRGTGPARFRLYITGDTLLFDDLAQIPARYPAIDLALLHLGGTRVLGLLVTMDARQGVEAIRLIRPQVAIPIHYNDYTVFKSSLEEFARAVTAAGLEERVRYLTHGDTYTFRVPPEGR